MKILSRDFTLFEKILIAILLLVIVGLAYYQFVDKPVRSAIESAEAEKEALNIELSGINAKIAELEKMQNDLDRILADPTINPMPSYNAIGEIRNVLNNLLGDLGYRITFSNVTKDNDQIRQNISMSFTAPDYDSVDALLVGLETNDIRCKIADVKGSRVYGYNYFTGEVIGADFPDAMNVSLSLTFYETMHGGTPDAGLPAETSAAN
ncbi:MAG: hypothetical protein IJS78_06905 [Clostridia bacterium]|nr:hypothetical protein [Clostridia bacterium]